MEQAYAESTPLVQPEDFNVFAFLAPRYPYVRSFLPAVMAAIPFTGTPAAQPVLAALAFLTDLDATKPKWRKLPPHTPLAFVDDQWWAAVCPTNGSIDQRMWTLCLAEHLRRLLRSSDILVPGSRQHRKWETYLHIQAAWTQRKASWFTAWYAPAAVDAYLDAVAERFDATVMRVADTWDGNSFARIERGKLVLTQDEKLEIPAQAKALRAAILALLPRIKLPALLIEVDDWLGYRQHFTHPNADLGRSWVATPTRAALPQPVSRLINGFVAQTDGEFGYQVLRPANWDVINLGDARGYFPAGSAGKANRVLLLVTNYQTLASMGDQAKVTITQLAEFQQDPSIAAWSAKREQD